MTNSYKTAITRTKLSSPMKYLIDNKQLKGLTLDYGCGKGFDAITLNLDKYDPYFFPDIPKSKYDTITCNYVFNVIPQDDETETLLKIKELLSKGGRAFISVRRDIIKEGVTCKGTYQRNVVLDLPILYECKNKYCIYILEN